jgi:hypothetical protein
MSKPDESQLSLYAGRLRLGHFIQIGKGKYKTFDSNHRLVGIFASRAKALWAIRTASSGGVVR